MLTPTDQPQELYSTLPKESGDQKCSLWWNLTEECDINVKCCMNFNE